MLYRIDTSFLGYKRIDNTSSADLGLGAFRGLIDPPGRFSFLLLYAGQIHNSIIRNYYFLIFKLSISQGSQMESNGVKGSQMESEPLGGSDYF